MIIIEISFSFFRLCINPPYSFHEVPLLFILNLSFSLSQAIT